MDDDGVCEHRVLGPIGALVKRCRHRCRVSAALNPRIDLEECQSLCPADNCPNYQEVPGLPACQISLDNQQAGLPADPECVAMYASPDQADGDGDGLGDRCETWAWDIRFETTCWRYFGLAGWFELCGIGDARVSFRGTAATLDPAGELRRRTSVESCHCPDTYTDEQGQEQWDDSCQIFECPLIRRFPWNPIRDDATFGPSGDPAYPYGGTDSQIEAYLESYGMGRDREVTFKRNAADNLHEFHWDWTQTKVYPTNNFQPTFDQTADLHSTDADPKPQKVRVSWPLEVVADSAQFASDEVDLSPGVRHHRLSLSHVGSAVAHNRFWWLEAPYFHRSRFTSPAPDAWLFVITETEALAVSPLMSWPSWTWRACPCGGVYLLLEGAGAGTQVRWRAQTAALTSTRWAASSMPTAAAAATVYRLTVQPVAPMAGCQGCGAGGRRGSEDPLTLALVFMWFAWRSHRRRGNRR